MSPTDWEQGHPSPRPVRIAVNRNFAVPPWRDVGLQVITVQMTLLASIRDDFSG